jgi:hypothetical protein
MAPREQLVRSLALAMESLLHDPERCRRMSRSAVDRVRRDFIWPQKAAQIVNIYRDLLGLPHDELRSFSLNGDGAEFAYPMESDEWPIAGHPAALPAASAAVLPHTS